MQTETIIKELDKARDKFNDHVSTCQSCQIGEECVKGNILFSDYNSLIEALVNYQENDCKHKLEPPLSPSEFIWTCSECGHTESDY